MLHILTSSTIFQFKLSTHVEKKVLKMFIMRQAALADTPENQLEPRAEAPHIHLMLNRAPGMRGGPGPEVSTLWTDPCLILTVRTKITLGNAQIAKTLTLSGPTNASSVLYLKKLTP